MVLLDGTDAGGDGLVARDRPSQGGILAGPQEKRPHRSAIQGLPSMGHPRGRRGTTERGRNGHDQHLKPNPKPREHEGRRSWSQNLVVEDSLPRHDVGPRSRHVPLGGKGGDVVGQLVPKSNNDRVCRGKKDFCVVRRQVPGCAWEAERGVGLGGGRGLSRGWLVCRGAPTASLLYRREDGALVMLCDC